MQIQKGTLQSVNGSTATAVSAEHPDIVTRELVIPFYWRELMGNLKPGEEVYYIEDDEHKGMIIGRTDGNWDQKIRGTLTVEEAVTMNDTLNVKAAVQADSTITASGEITSGAIGLTTHKHTSTAPGTPTTPPAA